MQQTSTCNRSPRHTEKTPWEPRGFGRAFGQKVLLQRHRTEGWGKNNQTKEGFQRDGGKTTIWVVVLNIP